MSTEYLTVTDKLDETVTLELAQGSGGIRLIIDATHVDDASIPDEDRLLKFWLRPEDVDSVCDTLRMLARPHA